jgi:hypothetical protein
LRQPQSFYSADALVTLFLFLTMALTWAASEGGMADTTSMAIISPRVISMEADFTAADFMEAAGTAVAATGRREEEMTDDRSQIANGASDGLAEIAEKRSIDEGFLEQALGALETLPDRQIDAFFDDASPA